MVREKVKASTWTLQWKCVESRADNKRLYYGRFLLSPLRKGQADTIGITMRRALLGEIERTCITRAKYEKIPHEYSTIAGIQESAHEILMNLKKIVLRSNLYGTQDASIWVKGPTLHDTFFYYKFFIDKGIKRFDKGIKWYSSFVGKLED